MGVVGEICRNPDCQVAKTGDCKLGHDPVETCDQYIGAEDHLDAEDLGERSRTAALRPIVSSDVMHVAEVAALMNERVTISVALISEQKAGKTTLLATIYELFCKGPFAGLSFVSSKTLTGFARRHFLALLSSGGKKPKVPRTSRDDPAAFFHLRLQDKDARLIDLVISDRSGEVYEAVRIDTDLIGKLEELPIARRVCFLLDGARLANEDTRPAYSRQFKQLIHALHDNGALKDIQHIEVLATKFDVTHSQEDGAAQAAYLADYEAQLVKEFAARGLTISCFRICALPKNDLSVGFKGLDELLERWTRAPKRDDLQPTPLQGASRQIDQYFAKIAEAK
jgi:hypothetical protein